MSADNPNFTIIAPGGCNSKCDFCTDPYNGQWDRDFMLKLRRVINGVLPSKFVQCSISGGEPTLSPIIKDILELVKSSPQFRKIVLTTNGAKLPELAEYIAEHVDHLNVSRHAIGYDANAEVFKTKRIISDEALKEVASLMNKKGVDVNLNHVYVKGSTFTKQYVHDFVAYAKSLNANSVSFRYDQGENNLEPTYLENYFDDYKKINVGGCPVCRNHTVMVDGFPVVFKASFEEPANASQSMYELIFHKNGTLTTDWAGKNEIESSLVAEKFREVFYGAFAPPGWFTGRLGSGGGCGGSSNSSGGGCG